MQVSGKSIGWRAWLPWAALIAVALAWTYRAPLVGRVYFFEDVADFFAPHHGAAAAALRAGRWPSWELGAWSGQPLVGDPQVGVFYPLDWLWLAVSPLTLQAWLTLAHAAIGAAGMASLARARGRSRAAAALSALAFALSAYFVLEVRHGMFLATAAWLPWVLAGIERAVGPARRSGAGTVLAVAVPLGLAVLGGGWSMLLWAVPPIAALGLFTVGRAPARARTLALLAGAAALGIALAAVQLAPSLAHARLSPRALGAEPAFAGSYAWPSWRYLVTLALPTAYGDVARGTYVGAPDQWEICGYGFGLVGALLAVAGVLLARDGRRRERWALVALLALACELARGDGGWLHPLLLRTVRGYDALRCPARALFAYTLVAPLLAADGLDALVERLLPSRRRAVAAALVGALTLELLVTWRAENPSVPRAETEHRPAVAAALATLLADGNGRGANDVHLAHDLHGAGLRWGVPWAGGYSSLPLWRTLHLYWIANHGRPYPHARLAHDLTAQGLWTLTSPLVDALAVRALLAPAGRPPGSGWSRVAAGADGIDLWRNDEALPLAFLVERQLVRPDEAAGVADAALDPTRVGVVARALAGVPPTDDPRGAGAPSARPVRLLPRPVPTALDLELDAPAPALLVVSESWSPLWRVTVDGQPAEAVPVDLALRGVAVPAGHHAVSWRYEDRPLRRGAAVSGAALALVLLLGGWLAARALRNRRDRSGVELDGTRG